MDETLLKQEKKWFIIKNIVILITLFFTNCLLGVPYSIYFQYNFQENIIGNLLFMSLFIIPVIGLNIYLFYWIFKIKSRFYQFKKLVNIMNNYGLTKEILHTKLWVDNLSFPLIDFANHLYFNNKEIFIKYLIENTYFYQYIPNSDDFFIDSELYIYNFETINIRAIIDYIPNNNELENISFIQFIKNNNTVSFVDFKNKFINYLDTYLVENQISGLGKLKASNNFNELFDAMKKNKDDLFNPEI